MKYPNLEFSLIHAVPESVIIDTAFTDRVMASLPSRKTLSRHVHRTHKRSLLSRLRHLPKFAVILLAIALLLTISGATYAIVETIKQMNVTVNQSGINNFGREEFTVSFDSCAEEKKAGTTYELKKDSGLSAAEGAKVIQARCDLDLIESWLQKDQAASGQAKYGQLHAVASTQGIVGTLTGPASTSITLHAAAAFTGEEHEQTFTLPEGARVVDATKVVDRSTLKPGDTLLYFSPHARMREQSQDAPDTIVVFKLNLAPKYYGLDLRSYVRARGACTNNPARTCLLGNSINSVTLIVSRGGAWIKSVNTQTIKNIQGKVVGWNSNEIKLDVGKGVIYTINTPLNVIDTYNQTTLKINVGDSLEVTYQEDKDRSSQTLEWSETLTIALLVERRVDDLNVLRKY